MKLRKLAFSFILLLGVMMLVAPMTHAQSSPNVEFVLDQGKIYLDDGGREINPTTHEFNAGLWYLDVFIGDTIIVDVRDYVSYNPNKTYTLTIYDVSTSSVMYTGDQLWYGIEDYGPDFEYYGSSFGEQFSKTKTLKVYWEESAEDYAPVLDGETAFVTTVDDPITESEIRSYLSAIDETDGNITHLITLSSDNFTPNNDTLGTYDLVYSVTDSGGNTATLTVSVIVKDVLAPTWNTSKQNVTVSYTATFDIEAYKSQLGALDNYDVSGSIAISIDANTYTTNKTIPGTYQVVYALEDLSGNSSLAEVNVTVIDDVKPTFSGASTISKPLSTSMTITQIKSQISANDAIDGSLTANIQVVSDDYTGNGNKVGDYDVQFSVTDNSGNIAYHTVTVQVIDDIPPVFYVRDGYFVAVDQVVSLSQQDFIDILVATGQITVSGSGTVEIYQLLNDYEGNESTPGIYALSFQAVTQSGDESIYNMAVEVLETTDGPVDVIEDQDGQDLALFWNTNKTYIIGGLILLLFVGLVIFVARKNKKHLPKKKKYKKVRK